MALAKLIRDYHRFRIVDGGEWSAIGFQRSTILAFVHVIMGLSLLIHPFILKMNHTYEYPARWSPLIFCFAARTRVRRRNFAHRKILRSKTRGHCPVDLWMKTNRWKMRRHGERRKNRFGKSGAPIACV